MKQWKKRVLSGAMAAVLTATTFAAGGFTALAGDTLPMLGEEARKAEQPKFSGYRIWDMRDWSPETDPYAEFLRAEIPLQKRIEAFKPTQANPELDSNAEIMLMQGDYGNAFVDGMPYNNTFLYHNLNFWQYTDYYSPWHGAITAKVPENLWDWEGTLTDGDSWQKRAFEFGILNIPNPAYTNAAHKNGAMSIACIYFDQNFREGQTVDELFVKDENGRFIVADKLIEMAKYFGYDGYFFNCEEAPYSYDVLKEWLYQLEEAGLYTQYYNTNSSFNESKAEWLESDLDGDGVKEKIQDSVFVNYSWQYGVDSYLQFAEENGYNPFKQVFFGVEANQGGFSGGHPSAGQLPKLYAPGTKNPRASIALFTPSDMYHRGVDEVKGGDPVSTADPNYMWMVAERERMYFSGVMSDPTNTGKKAGYSRPEVGVSDASGWVGVADFTSERSVVDGSVFYTNFNTGKGRSYWTDGKLTNRNDWTNLTVQDILPTWQWWVSVPEAGEGQEAYAKLGVDFDYGEKYYTEALDYKKIGGYNGGSSLVVAGKLEAENLVKLYKTELDVVNGSKMSVTYQKPSASDGSEMKLALIMKDAPEKVEYITIPDAGEKTNGWKTAEIDLSKFAGRKIATIGLAFNPGKNAVENYQMNIGEIRLSDDKNHTPAAPTGFVVDKAYATNDMTAKWDLGNFETVDKYEIYATLSNGEKVMVGTNYDSIHYIKSLENEKDNVKLELVAIGKDGTRSAAAVTTYSYSENVSNLKADTEKASTGNGVFTKRAGIIDLTWTNPAVDYSAIEFTVTLEDSTDDTVVTKTVGKDVTSASIVLPRGNGEKYQVAARTVFADGSKSDPMMITGFMKDVWSQSYEPEKVLVNGKDIELWQPDSQDWWKMYVYFNGEQLSFNGRFQRRDHVVRGHNKMTNSLKSDTGILTVVLEDYCGNLSEPMNLLLGTDVTAEITADIIPDGALRAKIIETVGGNTVGDMMKYRGALDLSNLGIKNLKGLELMTGVTSINLSGNTEIDVFTPGLISGMANLSELNISGMTGLKVFNIKNTSVETIVCEDVSALSELVGVDISGCRMDLSEGTPEYEFVEAVKVSTAGKEDIVAKAPDMSNLRTQSSFVSGNSALLNGGMVFGDTIETVVKFDAPQEIHKWSIEYRNVNWYGVYKNNKVEYSTDGGATWHILGEDITDSEAEVVTVVVNDPPAATHYRITISNGPGYGETSGINLYGYESVTYPAGVVSGGQRPALYPTFPENVHFDLAEGTVAPTDLVEFETLRGTKPEDLKGAEFLAADYDVDAQMGEIADMILVNDDPNAAISLEKDAFYTVTYFDFNEANPKGELKGTVKVVVGDPKEVDKSALESLVGTAEKVNKDIHTDESVKALEAALADAKAVLADDNATQEDVDNAYDALDRALNALVEKTEGGEEGPGTDSPDTGDYVPYVLPIILALAAISTFVMKKRLMK